MTATNYFKELHGRANEEFVPVKNFDGTYELKYGLENHKEEVETLKEKIPHLINDIYFVPNQRLYCFCYYKNNVMIDVFSLDWEVWKQFKQHESIEYFITKMEKAEQEKDFEYLFEMMEKKILISKYIEYFKKIPYKKRYDIFRMIWSRSEYDFNLFTPMFLKEVFAYKSYSEERNENIELLKKEIGNQKTITIYRGITNQSTPIDEAISWTLDVEVAEFFATRFDSIGEVYEAEIEIDFIHDYLVGRNEKEVLINPSNVKNIKLHS